MKNVELKQTLIDKQTALRQRLEAINNTLKRSHSRDWEEQAQERENDEVLEALAKEASDNLARINLALKKFDSDSYGICTECGAAIDQERLCVLPDTDLCIYCAQVY